MLRAILRCRTFSDARVERHDLDDVERVGFELHDDVAYGVGGPPLALDATPVGRNLSVWISE